MRSGESAPRRASLRSALTSGNLPRLDRYPWHVHPLACARLPIRPTQLLGGSVPIPAFTSFLTALRCAETGAAHDPGVLQSVSHGAGATLLPEYDLDAVRAAVTSEDIRQRPHDLWRFRELLPLDNPLQTPDLGAGATPLLRLRRLCEHFGLTNLWLKDEGANPTGTFKARGAAVGVARAYELGVRDIAIPTAGNAGSAWAAYCAAWGITLRVVMPVNTPDPIKAECIAYGADVTEVRGVISDAGRIASERASDAGWFDASTMKEPYRVEGKKTMGLEIAEAFDWDPPDVVLYPTGGGVGLIGVWKAMRELADMGWLKGTPPRLIAVQASGCAPIVEAWEAGLDDAERPPDPHTAANGLLVPLPFAHRLILRILRETGGTAIAVDDAQLVHGMRQLADLEGVLAAPEGAALVPALAALLQRGEIGRDERIVLLNTGNALKYTHLVNRPSRPAIDPLPA